MPYFPSRFGASIASVKAGIISSIYAIGSVNALLFVGLCVNTWGRRVGIGIGCIIIIQGTSHTISQYLAGRFFLGFGATITGSCAAST
jgi:MFS family permease